MSFHDDTDRTKSSLYWLRWHGVLAFSTCLEWLTQIKSYRTNWRDDLTQSHCSLAEQEQWQVCVGPSYGSLLTCDRWLWLDSHPSLLWCMFTERWLSLSQGLGTKPNCPGVTTTNTLMQYPSVSLPSPAVCLCAAYSTLLSILHSRERQVSADDSITTWLDNCTDIMTEMTTTTDYEKHFL